MVAPTIESPACQEQLTNAAKQVARAVEDLLVDAQAACRRSTTDGQRSFGDIHEAARQVLFFKKNILGSFCYGDLMVCRML